MPENIRPVSIGEIVVSTSPDDILVAYGLGSCVAVCLYDPIAQVGGMLHALLPTNSGNGHQAEGSPAKYVDQGISRLLQSVLQAGAHRYRLTARLCGGARMLVAPGFRDVLNIGQRNVETAENILKTTGLPVRARAIGGSTGRTAKFHMANGQIMVRTLGQPDLIL